VKICSFGGQLFYNAEGSVIKYIFYSVFFLFIFYFLKYTIWILGLSGEELTASCVFSGSNAAGRPSEDVDSRTIFVSNVRTLTLFLMMEGRWDLFDFWCWLPQVHFAATKDGLSRHFNRFGEVLKVIIVTDAATGQPKG